MRLSEPLGFVETSCGITLEDWSFVPFLDWSWDTALEPSEYEREDEKFQKLQLDAHNAYRALHGSAPLAYDPELAMAAQSYAEVLMSI